MGVTVLLSSTFWSGFAVPQAAQHLHEPCGKLLVEEDRGWWCWCRGELSPRLTKPDLCRLHQCPSQQLGAGGLPASPARKEGAAGGSGQQTVSSFHAGALACIEVLPGPAVLGGFFFFSPLFLFSLFFFLFPLTLACPLFEGCQSERAEPGECGGAEAEPFTLTPFVLQGANG